MTRNADVLSPRLPGHFADDPRFLCAFYQVVGKNTHPVLGIGLEFDECFHEVIQAAQGFDNNAFDPQVVTPDLLDQLRIVLSLNPDAAAPGNPRLGLHGTTSRGGEPGLLLRCWPWAHELY